MNRDSAVGARGTVAPEAAEILLLLSGGVDSAACLAFFSELGRPVTTLFIDYGQPAATAEHVAAASLAKHYQVPFKRLVITGAEQKAEGFITARNLMLCSLGLLEGGPQINAVALGIRSDSPYSDCQPAFIRNLEQVLLHAVGRSITIIAPLLELSKAEIAEFCGLHSVPTAMTYGCERGSEPCGQCISCLDRNRIGLC